ncbi:hypothetical protein L914_17987 [Phytophthora nicotianae]|uniref:Uncharacterized protein n=1 Tax=Phytophthora nicotianae TaxID=4792 RepID=W2MFH6_PHYNI|nr:hypothetical protein L914_17987 [Phytophthora nicotianae]
MTSDTVNEVAIDLSSAATGSASTTTSNATVTNSASPTTNCVSIVTDGASNVTDRASNATDCASNSHMGASKQRYICSWEPRFKLKEDSFEEEMGLADRWKALSVSLFETFWRKMMLAWDCLGR